MPIEWPKRPDLRPGYASAINTEYLHDVARTFLREWNEHDIPGRLGQLRQYLEQFADNPGDANSQNQVSAATMTISGPSSTKGDCSF
jgi:hypothetical protein